MSNGIQDSLNISSRKVSFPSPGAQNRFNSSMFSSSAPAAVIYYDKIWNANNSFLVLFDETREAVLNNSLLNYIPPKYHTAIRKKLSSLMESTEENPPDSSFVVKLFPVFLVRMEFSRITYEEVECLLVSIFFTMSELDRDYFLRERDALLRVMEETAKDVVFILDVIPELNIRYISPSVSDLSGFTPFEFYFDPSTLKKIVGKEDRWLFDDLLVGVADYSKPLLLRLVNKNGEEGWIEMFCRPEYNSHGQVISIKGSIKEITVKVQAEREARFQEKRFYQMMQGSDDSLYLLKPKVNRAGEVEDIFFSSLNERACEEIKRSCDQIEGKSVNEIKSPMNNPAFYAKLRESYNRKTTLSWNDITRNGAFPEKWIKYRIVCSEDCLIVTAKDISYEKQREYLAVHSGRILGAFLKESGDFFLVFNTEHQCIAGDGQLFLELLDNLGSAADKKPVKIFGEYNGHIIDQAINKTLHYRTNHTASITLEVQNRLQSFKAVFVPLVEEDEAYVIQICFHLERSQDSLLELGHINESLKKIENFLIDAELTKQESFSSRDTPTERRLLIPGRNPEIIDLNSIYFIRVYKNYTRVVTSKGTLTTRRSLKQWEHSLPVSDFSRINRKEIIRLSLIKSVQEWDQKNYIITLIESKERFRISKQKFKALKKVFAQ